MSAVGVLATPRVEQRRWNGPDGYFTIHWVVVTASGELLNASRRIKKFRSFEAARAALARVGGEA